MAVSIIDQKLGGGDKKGKERISRRGSGRRGEKRDGEGEGQRKDKGLEYALCVTVLFPLPLMSITGCRV